MPRDHHRNRAVVVTLAWAVVAGAVLSLGPARAWAAGTGGIELTPLPAFDAGGHLITAFHVSLPAGGVAHEHFELRNLNDVTHTEQLYAAAAATNGHGGYTIGGPGSAGWIGLADQSVTLGPHAAKLFSFDVHRHGTPVGPLVYGAIVQVDITTSVVRRVAVLVYLSEPGPGRVVPIALAVLAALVLLGAAALVARSRRSNR